MTAEYNAVEGRAELIGDGSGWQRMRGQFPTAPAAAKQAIYVMRIETDATMAPADSSLVWNAAHYYGCKFDSTFPSSSEAGHADYDNFFGAAAADSSAPYDSFQPNFNDIVDLQGPGISTSGHMYDGNGGTISTAIRPNITPSTNPYCIAGAPDKYPGVVTIVWRVYSHPTDNSVLYEAWLSTASFDLSTFDIANDMDPDDPKATFPVAWSDSGTIHGDTVGTNWRPSDGAMAFPQYFMAAHPGLTFALYIPYVGVQYSLSVT